MKSTNFIYFAVFFILFAVSCQKEKFSENTIQDGLPTSLNGLKRFNYAPTIFDLTSSNGATFLIGSGNDQQSNAESFSRGASRANIYIEKPDSIWINGLGRTQFYETAHIPAIQQTTRGKMFLGAIIRGDQALDLDNVPLLPIALADRNPVHFYASYPSDNATATISAPSHGMQLNFVNTLLASGTINQIQSFSYEQNIFRRVDELKKSFGANFNLGKILQVSVLDSLSQGSTKTRVRAEFTQENFSVSLEPPIYEPFFKAGINETQFNGYEPLIVSSVTYGRKGIMIIESDSSFSAIEKTLNVTLTLAADILGISSESPIGSGFEAQLSARLSKEQLEVIENSTINVYVIGVDGKSTVEAVTRGLSGFARIISESGNFNRQSPGEILHYTLNYVNDFSTFYNKFRVNVYNN